jgi:cyclopropane-fatty-acyl-phospholipid synthase
MNLEDSKPRPSPPNPFGFGSDLQTEHARFSGSTRRLGAWISTRLADTLEHRIEQWVLGLSQQGPLPLTLKLWTGREWQLGDSRAPGVTVKILTSAGIPYLIEPSLSNLGEAYVEGLIDVEGRLPDIVNMAYQLAQRSLEAEGIWGRVVRGYGHAMSEDKAAIAHHYDVSNDFYRLWLDPEMVYSCAYFDTGTESLAQAQLDKLDHILTKIQAQANDRLLDIGCGWGALVIRAAEKFGCHCVGITLSEKQYAVAKERVRFLGLENRVEIRLQDYREVVGEFERITSVGMVEHVGIANLTGYFSTIRRLLAPHGVAMNHGITSSDANNGQTAFGGGDFIAKYVFPGGELAHIGTVLTAMQKGGLEVRDVESLRRHYARTLTHWAEAFETKADQVRALVGEKVYRIWRIYLLGSAYAFERDQISLFQVVCGKDGLPSEALPWSRRFMYESSK